METKVEEMGNGIMEGALRRDLSFQLSEGIEMNGRDSEETSW